MGFYHGSTQTDINNMIHHQNENNHHYQQFYKEICAFLDVEYENDSVAWYQGMRPETSGSRGRRN